MTLQFFVSLSFIFGVLTFWVPPGNDDGRVYLYSPERQKIQVHDTRHVLSRLSDNDGTILSSRLLKATWRLWRCVILLALNNVMMWRDRRCLILIDKWQLVIWIGRLIRLSWSKTSACGSIWQRDAFTRSDSTSPRSAWPTWATWAMHGRRRRRRCARRRRSQNSTLR